MHLETTNEEGKILRFAKIAGRIGVIVAVRSTSSGKELEALWRPRELRELRERARKYRPAN